MTAPRDVHHSTLEVALEDAHHCTLEVERRPQPDAVPGLIVARCSSDKTVYHDVGKQAYTVYPSNPAPSLPITDDRRIFCLRRKTFFLILMVIVIVLVAAAVGGGVVGAKAARGGGTNGTAPSHESAPSTTIPFNSTSVTSASLYANTGMSALRWLGPKGTTRKRLYYQNQNNQIVESAWDDNNGFASAWEVTKISDTVKPGTPIGAVAGYPHASHKFPIVRLPPSLLLLLVGSLSTVQKRVLFVFERRPHRAPSVLCKPAILERL